MRIIALGLLLCASASGQEWRFRVEPVAVVVEESRPAVVEQPVVSTPSPKQRSWYLVSESWCQYCPAAKAKFVAKGWPQKNVITLAECQRRFGFRPSSIPYEFQEPDEQILKPINAQQSMSHAEMKAMHDRLHGGGSWTWPGDLATHLRETHGVKSLGTKPQPVQVISRGSSCPGGVCPTQSRLFGRRRR